MIWALWVVLRCTILVLCLRLHGLVWRLFSFGLSSCLLLLTLFSSSPLCILLDDICVTDIECRLYWNNSSICVIDLVFLTVLLLVLVLYRLVVFHFFMRIFVIFAVVMRTILLSTRYNTNNQELL